MQCSLNCIQIRETFRQFFPNCFFNTVSRKGGSMAAIFRQSSCFVWVHVFGSRLPLPIAPSLSTPPFTLLHLAIWTRHLRPPQYPPPPGLTPPPGQFLLATKFGGLPACVLILIWTLFSVFRQKSLLSNGAVMYCLLMICGADRFFI